MRSWTLTGPYSLLAVLLISVLFIARPIPADAGCGCDKPAPAPAVAIPHVAFPGMPVTLFHESFQAGQTWNVMFQNGATLVTVSAVIVSKRALTDLTGTTYTPQLVVTVPDIGMGPTRITAFHENVSFTVLESSFTVIGRPVAVAEQSGSFSVKDYTTGVGADGTLYVSVAGLDNVCQAMEFRTMLKNYPLRFGMGDVVITNHRGFFIDALDTYSADHFSILPSAGFNSNSLDYFRHSFARYCVAHQLGGVKEVDPQDVNWHRDGTAHTDYATLIFAIAGHFEDGTAPTPGSASFDLHLQVNMGNNNETWAQEKEEEAGLGGPSSSPSSPRDRERGRNKS